MEVDEALITTWPARVPVMVELWPEASNGGETTGAQVFQELVQVVGGRLEFPPPDEGRWCGTPPPTRSRWLH